MATILSEKGNLHKLLFTSNNSQSKIETFTLLSERIQKATHTQQLAIFKYIVVYPNVDSELQTIDVETSSALNTLLKSSRFFDKNNILTTSAANVLFFIYINEVGVGRAFDGNEFNQLGFNQFLWVICDITDQNFINTSSRINTNFPHLGEAKDICVFKIRGEELSVAIVGSAYSQLLTSAESQLNRLIAVSIRKEKPYSNSEFNSGAILFLSNRDKFFELCLRMTHEQLEEFITTNKLPSEGFFRMNSYCKCDFSGIFKELKKISAIKFSEEINPDFESKETKEEINHHLPSRGIRNFSAKENVKDQRNIKATEEKIDERLSFNTPEAAGKYLVHFLERASISEIQLVVKCILGVADSSKWSQEIQIALKSIKKYAGVRTPGQEFTLLEIKVLFIAYLKIFGIVDKGDFDTQKLRKYLRECGGKEFNIEPLFVIVVKIELEFVTVRVNGESVTIKQDLKRVDLMWRAMRYIHKCMLPLDMGNPYFIEDETADLCNHLRKYSGTFDITESQMKQIVLILERKKLAFPEKELRELLRTIPFKDSENDRKDAAGAAEVLIERYRKEYAMSRLITPPNYTELVLLFHWQPEKWYSSLESGKFSTSGLNESETGKRVIFVAINNQAKKTQNQTELNKFIKEFEEDLDKKCNHNLLTYDAMVKVAQETLALGEISPEEDLELRTYLSRLSDKQLSYLVETGDIIICVEGYAVDKPSRIEHLYNKQQQRRKFIEDAEVRKNAKIKSAEVNKNIKIAPDDIFTEFDRIFYGKYDKIQPSEGRGITFPYDDFFATEFPHIISEAVWEKASAPYMDEADLL